MSDLRRCPWLALAPIAAFFTQKSRAALRRSHNTLISKDQRLRSDIFDSHRPLHSHLWPMTANGAPFASTRNGWAAFAGIGRGFTCSLLRMTGCDPLQPVASGSNAEGKFDSFTIARTGAREPSAPQALRRFEGICDSTYDITAALSANSSSETTTRLLVPTNVKDRGALVT